MIFAIDFDGTLVEHKYPEIGEEIPKAFECLKKLKKEGHKLILWTCRYDEGDRKDLTEAVVFCKNKGIEFDAVNANIPGLSFNPYPKIYADIYIDDRALYCNWEEISKIIL